MSLSKIRAYNQILSQSITPAELSSSIAGTGLTGGAGSALSVVYGSGAGQAAQGNTSLSSRGTARQITVVSASAITAGSGGEITFSIPADFANTSGSFQYISGSQYVIGSGSFQFLSGSYVAAPTASFGVLNATVFNPSNISTTNVTTTSASITSGSITELRVTHINRADLFAQYVFNSTLIFSSSATSLSRWYINNTPVFGGSEMIFVNGMLQDSGSTNDYVIDLQTVSGSLRTVFIFNYEVPGDSKVKCSYIPIS